MPQLRQYISQEAARGRAYNTSRVTPEGVDVTGAARAVTQTVGAFAELKASQERVSAQLQADEARVSIANTMSDAQVMWAERMQKAQTEAPKGAAGFTESTLKEFDSWAKERTEQATHPDGRKLLENNLRQMRLGIHADAFKFEVGQRNRALVSDFEDGLDTDRRAVMADPSRFSETAARRIGAAQALNLPAETRQKLIEATRESLAFDAAQGLVDQDAGAFLERAGVRSAKGLKGKQGGQKEDAAERIASDPLISSMAPERLRQVVDRASTIVTQQEAAREAARLRAQHDAEMAAARRERAASQGWGIVSGLVADGRKLDMTSPTVQNAVKAMEGTPYAQAYRELLAEAPQAQAAAVLPIDTQQAQLDALMARRNTAGASPELENEIKRRESVIASARKDYEADALLAASERGVKGLEQLATVDMSSLDALAGSLAPRVKQADIASRQSGKPESPLTADEARRVHVGLSALPVEQKAVQVAKMTAAMPPEQAQALARQLDARDKPLALAFAAGSDRTTKGRFTAELILKGAQVMRDKGVKEDGGAEFGLRATIAKEVGDSIPAQHRDDVIHAARLISLAKQAEGDTIDAAGAVRLAIGGDLIEHNGRRVPVPYGMDGPALAMKLQKMPEKSISAQAPDGFVYMAGGRPMGVPEFLAALPAAQLEPVGLGRFAVRSGGSLVVNEKRRPIIIDAR